MRNYKKAVEAAYLFSRRQGNELRDRSLERSARVDRKNRYITSDTHRYGINTKGSRDMPDSYRTAESNYYQVHDNRGKGPRNYKRSDERIKEIVCDLLTDHPYVDASEIEVDVKDSEVTLSGTVSDKYAKRLAENLAENITGVSQVENRLRVQHTNPNKEGGRVTGTERSNFRKQLM